MKQGMVEDTFTCENLEHPKTYLCISWPGFSFFFGNFDTEDDQSFSSAAYLAIKKQNQWKW